MRTTISLAILGGLIIAASSASAQPAAPAPAAPAPPAAPETPRFVMTVPEGFEKVTVGHHTAVCQPNDRKWVTAALTDLDAKPATRPTTMPTDLLKSVMAARAGVIKQMVADLALPDDREASKLFDEQLIPTLTKMGAIDPPIFYLVLTRDRLKEICRTGWGEPRFHYNRIADEVSVNEKVVVSLEKAMDDSPMPAPYQPADPEDVRARKLAANIRGLDASLANNMAGEAMVFVATKTMEHVGEKLLNAEAMGMAGRDQAWLTYGAGGYFGCKYLAAMSSQMSREDWVRKITYENANFPVSSGPIDLVHPMAENMMRPEAQPYYRQAMRRKAVRVMAAWAADPKGGEASISKVLAAVRAKAPADGAALVKVIQDVGGVDLSKQLGPQ